MDVFHEKDLMRTYLHISHQAFVPELELAAGVGFDGDVAFNQVTGEFSTFSAGLMDTATAHFRREHSWHILLSSRCWLWQPWQVISFGEYQ